MKYTLVTGACGGLGGAFVRLLAERGEPLFLTGRDGDRLLALAEQLKERHPALAVRYYPADLADSVSRCRLFAELDRQGARIARLVYVAGVDVQKAFEKYTEEKLVGQARVNFEGAVSLIRAALSRSDADGNTEILCVGSVSGLYPMPYFALYSASKRALEQFCSALHTELSGRAKVTCALPGAIPTRPDVIENIRSQGAWGRIAQLPPEKVAKKCLAAVKRNKRVVIVGFWNRLMRAVTAGIPLSWKMKFIARRWSKTEKDAF